MSPEDVAFRLAGFLRSYSRDEARQKMIEMLLAVNETPHHATARVDMALEEMDGNPFRPIIAVNQDNGNLIEEARAAFSGANKPPSVFLRGGVLARVGRDDDGRAIIIAMTRPDIKATLAQMVSWSAITAVGKRTPSGVPAIVCDYFSAKADEMPDVPVIEAVVTAPVFAGDGTLITTPGYNPAARVWYQPVGSMRLRPVSSRPSPDEVRAAAWFLMTEYLGDFPYVDEASRQHALGCLLLPFARLMIDGPVPLQAADASTPGTGKGLLQRAQMFPALGSMLPALPGHFGDEDELKKLVTGILMEGQQVIRWDNVVARIDSPVLASLLTEPSLPGAAARVQQDRPNPDAGHPDGQRQQPQLLAGDLPPGGGVPARRAGPGVRGEAVAAPQVPARSADRLGHAAPGRPGARGADADLRVDRSGQAAGIEVHRLVRGVVQGDRRHRGVRRRAWLLGVPDRDGRALRGRGERP